MERFVVISSQGAIGRADGVNGDPNHKRGLSEDRVPWVSNLVSDGASLLEVVEATKPTCLLGLAAQPDVFTEEIVDGQANCAMSNHYGYNPITRLSVLRNRRTRGQKAAPLWQRAALDPVTLDSGRTLIPSQCNNMYVFGIGLARCSRVSPRLLIRCSPPPSPMESMTQEEIDAGRTFPASMNSQCFSAGRCEASAGGD